MRRPVIRDGLVVNVIEIEPGSDWTPPDSATLGDPHPDAVIGATVTGKGKTLTYTRPAETEPAPPEPDIGQRLAALETAVVTISAKTGVTVDISTAGRRIDVR